MPQHRNAQSNAALAQRPQQLFVMPSGVSADVARGQHPPAVAPPTVVDVPVAAAVVSTSSGVVRISGNSSLSG